MAKARSHLITIRASFDTPLSAKEARYAVWNTIQGLSMYGNGKLTQAEEKAWGRGFEPYGKGKITVRR